MHIYWFSVIIVHQAGFPSLPFKTGIFLLLDSEDTESPGSFFAVPLCCGYWFWSPIAFRWREGHGLVSGSAPACSLHVVPMAQDVSLNLSSASLGCQLRNLSIPWGLHISLILCPVRLVGAGVSDTSFGSVCVARPQLSSALQNHFASYVTGVQTV